VAEWKWDGIRCQLVRRRGRTYLWSRGEELVTDRFPEVVAAATRLPDGVVLDGEVLAYRGRVLPFAVLQRRIGRQKLDAGILAEAPVALMAYDLLEEEGEDRRERPLAERRARLESILAAADAPALPLSPLVAGESWEALAVVREEARARGVEGLMLKRLDSPYRAGRRKGDWWKWKIAPFTVDAVLLYAHPGHGRRASLFTDYTFAVWDRGALVPVARAYSGLSDAEIGELDGWVRRHTRQRHGPTRVVEPSQVFELAFEGIQVSSRHRAGVAVRFPRILRWRKDKPAAEADTLDGVRRLLGPPAVGN
jgi:DNA ligase-1